MTTPLDIFRSLEPPLEDIKELAGSTEAALAVVQRQVGAGQQADGDHRAAGGMPGRSCGARQRGIAGRRTPRRSDMRRRCPADFSRARDASSAAAGALMLIAKARTEIQSFFRPPQLP